MNQPKNFAGSPGNRLRTALVRLLPILLLFSCLPVAQAFTSTPADEIFSAHCQAFYFINAEGGFFRATNGVAQGNKTEFWTCAEQLEMTLDVFGRSSNAACLDVFSNVFNGFIASHGTNWQPNPYNDDIMWMVIACARAYQLTGNPAYRDTAKLNFDLCYARAWDTNSGGGLWWKTDNRSKNACVNGPGAIAAFLLYQIYHDAHYRARSKAIFKWERKTLYDPTSGRVRDNINTHGRFGFKAFTYNQGTFIGAANFLGYTKEAKRAADFTKNTLCQEGILPAYGREGDAAGFNGIFVRWLARFMNDHRLQRNYQAWLQANADAAWRCRRASDDLSWSNWLEQTPAGPLNSWACSSSVVILQVVPPTAGLTGGR
ncbi:MAG: glycoside hydrolase family 76 protein [Verrucomicrobiota bacterium]|jgi:predicted alpha-1,6-mannanase (GH76 family)